MKRGSWRREKDARMRGEVLEGEGRVEKRYKEEGKLERGNCKRKK